MTIPAIARPLRLADFAQEGFKEREEFLLFSEYDVVLDDDSMDNFDRYIGELKTALGDNGYAGVNALKRFHLYSYRDIGHSDIAISRRAVEAYKDLINAIAKSGGTCLTIHIGLMYEEADLCFETAKENLAALAAFSRIQNVQLCVENLKSGFTSDPKMFAELIEHSGAYVTFDIGHATSSAAAGKGLGPLEFLEVIGHRVINAHIYEYEIDGIGHLAPCDLSVIGPVLVKLRENGCAWWVIELPEGDLCSTRELLYKLLYDTLTLRPAGTQHMLCKRPRESVSV